MSRFCCLVLFLLGGFVTNEEVAGQVHAALHLSWPSGVGQWGDWGAREFCPPGSYAYAFKLKVEEPIGDGDDTALNGISLHCGAPGARTLWKELKSSVQEWGSWKETRTCSSGFLTGLRMKVEPHQGSGDDTAANDLEMRCRGSSESHYGGGTNWGIWSSWANCANNWAICGLETRVERQQGNGDDTALGDVRMYCCQLPN